MDNKIEKAIRTTLVIENKKGISFAVKAIKQILEKAFKAGEILGYSESNFEEWYKESIEKK